MSTATTAIAHTRTSSPPAATTALVVLLLALLARPVFALWERYDGSVTYEELQLFGGAYWPMNVLVFGPAFAIGFAAQAVLAWPLGHGRAAVVARCGAVLLLVGGVAFALTGTAHALPYDWAANQEVLDEPTGRVVVEAFGAAGSDRLVPYIVGAQALIALGALVTAVGARLSGTIPTWLLAATLVVLMAFLVAPAAPGSSLEVALSLAQVLLWAALGFCGWRAARTA